MEKNVSKKKEKELSAHFTYMANSNSRKKWVANFSLHEPISHKYTQISDKSQLCILKATCLQNERHF